MPAAPLTRPPNGAEVGRHLAAASEAAVGSAAAGVTRNREIVETTGAGDDDLAIRLNGESVRDGRRSEIREDLAASAEA